MELTKYDVIIGVVATPKSLALRNKLGKITFKVHKEANKIMVRDAVEKIWDVKVRDVRVVVIPGKNKMIRRRQVKMSDTKKAIVTLRSGYTIDLPDQYESMGVPAGDASNKKEA